MGKEILYPVPSEGLCTLEKTQKVKLLQDHNHIFLVPGTRREEKTPVFYSLIKYWPGVISGSPL